MKIERDYSAQGYALVRDPIPWIRTGRTRTGLLTGVPESVELAFAE